MGLISRDAHNLTQILNMNKKIKKNKREILNQSQTHPSILKWIPN